MIALILAGGSGTRFWPLSTETLPKQFLKLFDDKSMIRLTFERVLNLCPKENIYFITTQNQTNLIKEHIPEIENHQIIIEPFGMNTAPCIALSTIYLSKIYEENEQVVILPADHYIPDTIAFSNSIKTALNESHNDVLITFGITPTYPATGYGYIETGEKFSNAMFHVKHFKEKPELNTAIAFLNSGNFYWNSGMFCWSLKSILNNYKRYQHEMLEICEKVLSIDDQNLKTDEYKKINKLPIDIAILEKANNVVVLPVNFIWSDVGNWFSLSQLMPKDENGNYFNNSGYADNAKNNYINTNKFTAILGVSNLLIIESKNGILIANKDNAEEVKKVVQAYMLEF